MYKIFKSASPQCGSDGRTYQNLCLLNCAKMRCPEKTAGVTARAGECDQADQKQGLHEKPTDLSVFQKNSVNPRQQMIKNISKLHIFVFNPGAEHIFA